MNPQLLYLINNAEISRKIHAFIVCSSARISINLTSKLLQVDFNHGEAKNFKVRWCLVDLLRNQLQKSVLFLRQSDASRYVLQQRDNSKTFIDVLLDPRRNPVAKHLSAPE